MGGGARAAYQAGVLKAIAALLRDARRGLDPTIAQGHNPFPILLGTSAGAINAAALAARADNFQEAVAQIVHFWEDLRAEDVYRADAFGVIRSGARWLTLLSIGWMLRRSWRMRPRSLLDNEPLRRLLGTIIDEPRLARALERGHLRALAVTASSYSSGRHVTFYQALRDYDFPAKRRRVYVRDRIGTDHLLASSAIPFVFPAVALDANPGGGAEVEFFGDGSMRQLSPVSPAIRLGAERILVIGVGHAGAPGARSEEAPDEARDAALGAPGGASSDAPAARSTAGYPSLARVAGHALATIFLDALASDVERLERMNRLAAGLTAQQRETYRLRPIETLVIAPSEPLDGHALQFRHTLPRPVRALFEVLGGRGGAEMLSYLLFESAYTQVLIDLGFRDTMARRDAVLDFLTDRNAPSTGVAPRVVVV